MAARWLQQKMRKLKRQRRGGAPVKQWSIDKWTETVIAEKQLRKEYLKAERLIHKGKSRTQAQSGERQVVKREFLSSQVSTNAAKSLRTDEERLQSMSDLFPEFRGRFRDFKGTTLERMLALERAELVRDETQWERNIEVQRNRLSRTRMFFNEKMDRFHFVRVDIAGVHVSRTFGSRNQAIVAWQNHAITWDSVLFEQD